MPIPTPIKGVGWEDGSPVLMADVGDLNDDDITQDKVTSITAYMVDNADFSTQITTFPKDISKTLVIFDTFVTDKPIWTVTSTGYNFRYDDIPLDDGNKIYTVEFWVNPATGNNFLIGPFVIDSNRTSGFGV